jgi:hypothetical protein
VEPARSIGQLGFKKWYERRLIECHAWLVTAFLCLIVIAASLEDITFKGNLAIALGKAGVAFVAGLISWLSVRRYLSILGEAERFASHATCASCGTYAAFSVIAEAPLTARCRKCGHEWTFH